LISVSHRTTLQKPHIERRDVVNRETLINFDVVVQTWGISVVGTGRASGMGT
jgi:hypothetical protein